MASLRPLFRQVGADSSLAFAITALAAPLGYLNSIIMARLYGAALMGTYFIVLNLIVTVGGVCCLGLPMGLIRFFSAEIEKGPSGSLRRLFWLALGTVSLASFAGALLLWLLKYPLTIHFNAPNLPAILIFMVLALPVYSVTALLRDAVRALGRVRWAVFQQNVLAPLGFGILIVFLAYLKLGPEWKSWGLGLAFCLSSLIGLGFLFLCPRVKKFLLKAPAIKGDRGSFREVVKYSLPLFLFGLLALTASSLDILILGFFTAPNVVAYYGVAIRTAALVILPLSATYAVVPPLIVQFYQHQDFSGLESVARTTSRWAYLIAFPLALLIILLAPQVLDFFGLDFRQAQFAMTVIILGQLANVFTGSAADVLMMTGHQWTTFRIQIVNVLLMVVLSTLGAATFGLDGIAVAFAMRLAGINLITALAVWRHLKVKTYPKSLAKTHLAGLAGVLLFFLAKPFGGAYGGAVCFCLGYLAILGKTFWQEIRALAVDPAADAEK